MSLDWTTLGQVTAVSIGVTVAVVVVFALGVLGLARRDVARGGAPHGDAAREEATHGDAPRGNNGTSPVLGLTQAGLCFAACAAVVVYGVCLIVPQFH
jgi:hypothetical protein